MTALDERKTERPFVGDLVTTADRSYGAVLAQRWEPHAGGTTESSRTLGGVA